MHQNTKDIKTINVRDKRDEEVNDTKRRGV